ncbi:MAG: two-component system, NtrC family, sensor kinase [Pseudomonadota bacterium]|nr:two-component system, NtrC family, sensor kinase [Pseudomonadota bacterium]
MNPIARMVGFFQASVRVKLLFLALAPLLLGFPLIMALVWYWSNTSYQQLLTYKVSSDLVTAHEYMDRVVRGVGGSVEALAETHRLRAALASNDRNRIAEEIGRSRRRHGLDFMYVLDAEGKVVHASAAHPARESHASWPVVSDALAGRSGSVIDIYGMKALEAIDPSLRDRAAINIVPTPQARPDSRQTEERGMLIHAAAPMTDAAGKVIGVLEGGMLLNGNLGFVDTINSIVYRDGSLPLGSKGTATLFLDDTRIATNVRLFEDERALGTRVSQQVREFVLEHGSTWLGTAFVVNDFYVSGYEPVVDSFGKRVGMLYVGFLEAPFLTAKENALKLMFAIFAAISLIGSAWSLKWAREVMHPISLMKEAIVSIDRGDVAARVGETGSRDELGLLAAEFDRLLDVLAEKRNELQRWANELDCKVTERTQALAAANAELRMAQRQLVTSEKLAAIGELTAGVAHEINNPIAVIQGNLDVLRDVLGVQAVPVAQEIRLIDEQVHRIRIIVTKLLQFARPGEFAGYVEEINVNEVLADCLVLAQHHLVKRNIEIVKVFAASRWVSINRHELQQVLINLIVNAVQAMPDGGKLTLATADWLSADGDCLGTRISVQDSGDGIAPEDLSRIFDPFFTTKKNEGTGLGLSISHSLIKRYGGNLTVESVPGQGAVFSVWLRIEPDYASEGAR